MAKNRVSGLPQLVGNIGLVMKAESAGKIRGINRSGRLLLKNLKAAAPRDTGFMARELNYSPATQKRPYGVIGSGRGYSWIFTEFGTETIAAQGWARRTIQEHARDHKRIMAEEIVKALGKSTMKGVKRI